MAHAVGFNCDVSVEAVSADSREVIGAVERSAGIELTADAFEELLDAIALRVVETFAALEHQVFEDVRRPGRPGHFVA
jgi:hypothetical protein